MPTLKYIGTADNWPELGYTGKQSVWQIGQMEERGATEYSQLMASGLFSAGPGVPTGANLSFSSLANARTGRKVLCFGDSLMGIAETFGYAVSYSPVQAWLGGRSALETPIGGTGTLTYVAATKLMTYTAYGDTAGTPVDVSTGGIFVLRSGNPDYWHRVPIIRSSLPVTDVTTSLTLGTPAWQRWSGIPYLVDALTKHRFDIENYGVPGDTAQSAIFRVPQAVAQAPDVVIEALGTNDVSGSRSAAQIVADRSAIWDAFLLAGIPVIATTIAARWGSGGDNTNYSASKQLVIAQTNKLLIEAAQARNGVFIAECYSGSVDPASLTGVVKTGFTSDGLHPGSTGAQIAYVQAKPIVSILESLFPKHCNGSIINAGQASQYDATNNPGGNLLIPAGVGSFAGTGGTGGTGVTVGTGLATGISGTVARTSGTAAAAVANKVAATDGGADWQEFVVTGSTDEASFRFNAGVTLGNFATGDWIEQLVEVQIIGTGCVGVWMDLNAVGGVNPSNHRAYQTNFMLSGITESLVLALEPQKWISTGVTTIYPRIYFVASPTASYSIRFRNWSVHKRLNYSYP